MIRAAVFQSEEGVELVLHHRELGRQLSIEVDGRGARLVGIDERNRRCELAAESPLAVIGALVWLAGEDDVLAERVRAARAAG